MCFLGKNTSKHTVKLTYLMKLEVGRIAVVRQPRVTRQSIARGEVRQLLAIGDIGRALHRAEQVIEDNNVLGALDYIEIYCKILVERAAQMEKPKECSKEIKEAAAGLIFASAKCGELSELQAACSLLADKFGQHFAQAAKEGSDGVDRTFMRKFPIEPATLEQKWNLLHEFPENIGVTRESNKYLDARMAAEAAFELASFATMAARAAVELSRSESQGKGSS